MRSSTASRWPLPLLATLLLAAHGAFVLAADEPRLLLPGPPLSRTLTGGETHTYRVEASAGQRLLVTVEQKGIDVVVRATAAGGKVLSVVDSPNDRQGPESLLLPAGTAGSVRIDVVSPTPAVPTGAYEIRLEALAEGTAAERDRLEAERLLTLAAERFSLGTKDARLQAVDAYQTAVPLWHRLGDSRREAQTLYCLAMTDSSLGELKPSLEMLRRALALWTELGDTGAMGTGNIAMGLALWHLGDMKGALAALERAQAIERERGDRYGELLAVNNLCLVHHSQSELEDALKVCEQALEMSRQQGEPGREAGALHNLASVYDDLGQPQLALERYAEGLTRLRAVGDKEGEAQTLNNQGVVYAGMGELDKALSHYEEALARFREIGNRFGEARTLGNLGATYYSLGEPQRALPYFDQALAQRRAAGDRRGEVVTANNLGLAYLRLGELGKAQETFRRALALAQQIEDRGGQAYSLRQLAGMHAAAGDLKGALAELAQSLTRERELGDRRGESAVLYQTGTVHLRLGEPETARCELETALALRHAASDRVGEIETLSALARAEHELGNLAEAGGHVVQAITLVESLRTGLTNPDLRASFLGSQREAYELDVDLQMDLDRREPGHGHAQAALEASERARARTLLDLLYEAKADIRHGVDPELRERERALAKRLSAKIEALSGSAADSGAERREAERALQPLLEEIDRVEAEIRRTSPRYAALTQLHPSTLPEIQRLLDGRTLLLEYALGDERSFLWAVDATSATGFQLPPRAQIEAAARDLYGRLKTLEIGAPTPSAASALSRTLLGPVAERLRGKRLVIVADGALQYIPFGALPAPAGSGVAGQPLLVEHEVVALPSASVLSVQRRELADRPAAPKAVAVLADPVFDRRDPRVSPAILASAPKAAAPTAKGPRRSTDERGSPDDGGFSRLPATRREAHAIAALVPPDQALTALDFRASRETALAPELGDYRLVHFATHGLINARTPELSGLVLSLVGADGTPREGFLSLGDIYNLQLKADLVVLSGCETALGREIRGEGLVGLSQGFLYAGARRVVASLWRVQDRATAELMARFYRAMLIDHMKPAAALRSAQLSIRAEKRWRDPYYWAPFVLQGDWE